MLQRGFKRGRIEASDGKRLVRVKVIGGSGTADREPPWGNGGDIGIASRNGKYSTLRRRTFFKPGATRPSSEFRSPVRFGSSDTSERRFEGFPELVIEPLA
jgi:hypothetical protein